MLFEERSDFIVCEDWCDIAEDEVIIGRIVRHGKDGYWRFMPHYVWLTCSHLKNAAKKLSELNKGL